MDDSGMEQLNETNQAAFQERTKKEFKASCEYRDPGTLIPYALNSVNHSEEQVRELASKIAFFGFDQPIVVDRSAVIIKGHARREAALLLGLKEVPVIVRDDLSEAEMKAARISDNKVSEMRTWHFENLKLEFEDLRSKEFNLAETSFDAAFVNELVGSVSAPPAVDAHRQSEENKEAYENSPIRELKFFFASGEFSTIVARLEAARTCLGLEDYSQLLVRFLENFERTNNEETKDPPQTQENSSQQTEVGTTDPGPAVDPVGTNESVSPVAESAGS